MKKKIIFLALYFILLGHTTSAQKYYDKQVEIDNANLRCTYMLYFKSDSSQNAKTRNEKMELFIGEDCSQFFSHNKLIRDSLLVEYEKKGTPIMLVLANRSSFPIVNFTPIVYKNFPDNKITVIDRMGGTKYKYNHSVGEFNWQIQPDTLTIADYKCQLATCCYGGREYEAWFTLEVPISDGPYKFHGLPGLIVRIYDIKMEYDFDLISVKKIDGNYPINYPIKKYPQTTLAQFTDMKRRHIESMFERGGVRQTTFPSEEFRIQARNRALKSISNPIELEY